MDKFVNEMKGGKSTFVIGCSNGARAAKILARTLGMEYSALDSGHFPDSDSYVRIMTEVRGKRVLLVQSLHPNTNDAMMELILAASTCRELGARHITLVVPYLAYMRQDKRFHPGECVSSKIMGRLLSSVADAVITIDPHLHRYKRLSEVFSIPARHATANLILGKYIRDHISKPVIIGPDAESYQWAEEIASVAGGPVVVLHKKRYGSQTVRIKLNSPVPLRGRNIVIVDDIISTGHTMHETVKQARRMGAKKVYCIGVHGVFASGALQRLQRAGAVVLTTNTIDNPVARIDITSLLAGVL